MAKQTSDKVRYANTDAGLVGTTRTEVTIGDNKWGDDYDYPVIRVSDLTPEAQAHVLAYFKTREAADKAVEFGPKNRLAGYVQAQIRSRLVAPSVATIKKNLMELVGELLNAGEVQGATDLAAAVKDADEKGMLALWEANLKQG
jgi:hypothetical protein